MTGAGANSAPRWWCAFFIIAILLYAMTANRGVQAQDSGWQQYRIVTGQLEHPHGLALCHPVQYYLGRLAIRIPGLAPAFAITLVSTLAAAVAIANLAATIILLTRRATATVIAVTALMLSHTFWQHATHTESYTLAAALLTGEWLCLASFAVTGKTRYLLLTALLNGLGTATHLLATLALPVDVAVVIWAVVSGRCARRTAVAAALLWLLGTLPYSGLVLATMLHTADIPATLASALFGGYAGDVLNVRMDGRGLALSAAYVAYNFPGLTVPLALLGIYAARRTTAAPRWLARLLTAELVIYALFVIRYPIPDQYTFFFPAYLLLTLLAGLGLARLLALPANTFRSVVVMLAALTAVWTPIVYLGTCSILRSRGLLTNLTKHKPYRDGHRAFFVPWGLGADHAEALNQAVRQLAGSHGLVLVEDHMQSFGLHFAQVVGELPATVTIREMPRDTTDQVVFQRLEVVNEHLLAERPVLLVPHHRDRPAADLPGAQWERCGDIYRLIALRPPAELPPGPDG